MVVENSAIVALERVLPLLWFSASSACFLLVRSLSLSLSMRVCVCVCVGVRHHNDLFEAYHYKGAPLTHAHCVHVRMSVGVCMCLWVCVCVCE